ncbi:Glyco-hydro-79C domain-containing protein [Mycena kentingensis (nom. inval.)]|nr:Glyco-hydro-79C domain-containing protein [Mycena kentingensis (nom. inval.)]
MVSLISVLLGSTALVNAAVQVSVPATPSASNVVESNFLGISYELSYLNEYFGNDTNTINMPMLNYLGCIRARTRPADSVRVRIGGNSADSSPYYTESSSPMVQLVPGDHNANDQPVTYNSEIWKVMSAVHKSVGGVAYSINIPLAIAPNASLTDDIRTNLGDSLDSLLLGNEPDLYFGHKKRTGVANYTVQDYFGEYAAAIKTIGSTDTQGKPTIAGPSICCAWDLATLLQQGYLTEFASELKYIVLQHYPQNNCNPGKFPYQLPYYLQHANVVKLAQWQKPGIDYLMSQPVETRPKLMNSEFNSASCGGVPFSPAFGVGAFWALDYALQMASVGYSQAFLHTREAGISYNMVKPPFGPAGAMGPWTTNAPFYAMLAAAEGLFADNSVIVQDLNIDGSSTNVNVSGAGYAVYDATNKTITRLILFNGGSAPTDFALPASVFSSRGTALVKFLAAAAAQEETNISWGGETWGPGVEDGKSTQKPSWAVPNQNLKDCKQNGCTFTAPGPSVAMVFLDDSQDRVIAAVNPTTVASSNPDNGSGKNSTESGGGGGSGGGSTGGSSALRGVGAVGIALSVLFSWASLL